MMTCDIHGDEECMCHHLAPEGELSQISFNTFNCKPIIIKERLLEVANVHIYCAPESKCTREGHVAGGLYQFPEYNLCRGYARSESMIVLSHKGDPMPTEYDKDLPVYGKPGQMRKIERGPVTREFKKYNHFGYTGLQPCDFTGEESESLCKRLDDMALVRDFPHSSILDSRKAFRFSPESAGEVVGAEYIRKVMLTPDVMGTVDHILGYDWKITSMEASMTCAGAGKQRLHSDVRDEDIGAEHEGRIRKSVQLLLSVDSKINLNTEFYPKTRLEGNFWRNDWGPPKTVDSPRILMEPRMGHNGAANKSGKVRWMISATFSSLVHDKLRTPDFLKETGLPTEFGGGISPSIFLEFVDFYDEVSSSKVLSIELDEATFGEMMMGGEKKLVWSVGDVERYSHVKFQLGSVREGGLFAPVFFCALLGFERRGAAAAVELQVGPVLFKRLVEE